MDGAKMTNLAEQPIEVTLTRFNNSAGEDMVRVDMRRVKLAHNTEKTDSTTLEMAQPLESEKVALYKKTSELITNPAKKEALRNYLASHGYPHETNAELYESTWILNQRVAETKRKNETTQYVNEINKNLNHNLINAEINAVQAELSQNTEIELQLWQTIDSEIITSEQVTTLLQQHKTILEAIASSKTKLVDLQKKSVL
jgi:hypothetical protein